MTVSGFFYKKNWQDLEWIILASIAVAKSRQNIWIFVWDDFFTKVRTQLIISFSIYTGIKLSFTLHFCNIARQNRWVTFPFYCYFKIFMIFWITTSLPPYVMYSIPLRVDTITLIKEVIACFKDLFFMFKIYRRNSKFSVWTILKISLLISYSTRLFLSSGAICNALTLRLRRI